MFRRLGAFTLLVLLVTGLCLFGYGWQVMKWSNSNLMSAEIGMAPLRQSVGFFPI